MAEDPFLSALSVRERKDKHRLENSLKRREERHCLRLG